MYTPALFGDNLFDSFFDSFTSPVRSRGWKLPHSVSSMKTDIRETDTEYDLDVELPGYKKEDVKAQLKDGVLTINASVGSEKEERDEDGRFICRERYSGSCSRSFYVGDRVTQEDIKARFDDGILKIVIPKKEIKPEVEEEKYIAIEG